MCLQLTFVSLPAFPLKLYEKLYDLIAVFYWLRIVWMHATYLNGELNQYIRYSKGLWWQRLYLRACMSSSAVPFTPETMLYIRTLPYNTYRHLTQIIRYDENKWISAVTPWHAHFSVNFSYFTGTSTYMKNIPIKLFNIHYVIFIFTSPLQFYHPKILTIDLTLLSSIANYLSKTNDTSRITTQ